MTPTPDGKPPLSPFEKVALFLAGAVLVAFSGLAFAARHGWLP